MIITRHSRFMVSMAFLIMTAPPLVAQTGVTTNGGSAGTVPVFTGNSSIGNSSVTVSPTAITFNGSSVFQVPSSGASNYFLAGSTNSTLTSGSYNLAMQDQSLAAVTTGQYNFGLGFSSLNLNTGGTGNNGFGMFTLQHNTVGSFNVALGNNSLQALADTDADSASGNVAVGNQALWSLATGGYSNTSLGKESLVNITRGSDNVAIGDGAGDDTSDGTNTNSSNGIYLGASTTALHSGDNNEIVIGAFTQGYGTNSITLGTSATSLTVLRGNLVMTPSGSGASMTFADGTVQSTAWNGVLQGGDYAESVDVEGTRVGYTVGDIIAIDPSRSGTFTKSSEPYSTLVSGVYSTKPGLVGRRATSPRVNQDAEVPMAIMGIVPTKVCAENGTVKAGDLLVSSSTSGYAMKGTDVLRLPGAVIGKALASLNAGCGLIEALITVQ